MNKRKLTLAAAVMMLAAVVPATAYHIDGNEVDTTAAGGGAMSSADWEVGTDVLIICESNGDHSSRNPLPGGRHGQGGLCTTGENDATGVNKSFDGATISKGTYIELDTCDVTTVARNVGDFGPYPNSTDAAGCPGGRSTYGFTAELGIYTCEVQSDEAFFYDRLYAWWSYDGAPHYDHGDDAGDVENTANAAAGIADPNNEDAFHGHVAVFINATDASPPPVTGSVVTALTGVTWSTATGAERCDSAIGSNGTPVFVADDS